MLQWNRVSTLVLFPVLLTACAKEVSPPVPVERPGLFTISTAMGPVDVLSFRDDPSGSREVRVHAVYPDGHHAVREVRIRAEAAPGDPDGARTVHSIWAEGIERLRLTRDARDDGGLETSLESGGEHLRLWARREPVAIRFGAVLRRAGLERTWETVLEPARAHETAYVVGVQESLRSFYGDGPLAANEDLALLVSVMESEDWSGRLVEGDLDPSTPDDGTRRRIQQVCVAAAVASKVSCFVSRFTPWGMIVCIPSTGINLACLMYTVAMLSTAPDPLPPPRPCTCGCVCGD